MKLDQLVKTLGIGLISVASLLPISETAHAGPGTGPGTPPTPKKKLVIPASRLPRLPPPELKYVARMNGIHQDVYNKNYDVIEDKIKALAADIESDPAITSSNTINMVKIFSYDIDEYVPEQRKATTVQKAYTETNSVPTTYIKGAGKVSILKVGAGILGSAMDVAGEVLTAGRSSTDFGPDNLRKRKTIKVRDAYTTTTYHPAVCNVRTVPEHIATVRITPYSGKKEIVSTRPIKREPVRRRLYRR